jgi:hypothetical protein
MAIGTQLIAQGEVTSTGVIMPEFAFDPHDVFEQLALRQIKIHEKIRFTSAPQL